METIPFKIYFKIKKKPHHPGQYHQTVIDNGSYWYRLEYSATSGKYSLYCIPGGKNDIGGGDHPDYCDYNRVKELLTMEGGSGWKIVSQQT